MEESSSELLIVGGAFMGSGAVLIAIAGFFLWRTRTFLATAVDTTGTVVGHSASSGGEGGTVYHPIIAFQTAEGRRVQFEDRMGSNPPRHEQGEAVQIKYDPTRPEKARLSGTFRLYFVPGLLALIGAPMLIAGVAFMLVAAT